MSEINLTKGCKAFHEMMTRRHRRQGHLAFFHMLVLALVALIPLIFIWVAILALPVDFLNDLNPPTTTVFEARLWSHQIIYLSALALTVFFSFAVFVAQTTILRRHWADLRSRAAKSEDTELSPSQWAVMFGFAFLVLAILITRQFPSPLLGGESQTSRLFLVPLTFLALLFLPLAMFVTAQGTYLYANHFPTAAQATETAKEFAGARADETDWSDVAAKLAKAFKHSEFDTTQPVMVNSAMGASAINTVITALTRLLSVLIVVFLVTAWLGIDLLLANLGLTGQAEDVTAAKDAIRKGFLIAIGAGLSLALSVIYLRPAARIDPFLAAEAGLKPKPAASPLNLKLVPEDASDSSKGYELTVAAAKKSAGKPEKFDPVLRNYLGANRNKFITILEGAKYGGGFHGVLEPGSATYIKDALTLLAPTGAATILAFLG